jgi:bifunctional enzyme CysN/CysC
MLPESEFLEILIDNQLAEAEARDVKGLYKKASNGELKNFPAWTAPRRRLTTLGFASTTP